MNGLCFGSPAKWGSSPGVHIWAEFRDGATERMNQLEPWAAFPRRRIHYVVICLPSESARWSAVEKQAANCLASGARVDGDSKRASRAKSPSFELHDLGRDYAMGTKPFSSHCRLRDEITTRSLNFHSLKYTPGIVWCWTLKRWGHGGVGCGESLP